MAEMLIQSENLVSIADEVRELSDTTDKMSLSAMTSNLQEANADVNTQSDLIAQIQSALNGKVGGNIDSVNSEYYTSGIIELSNQAQEIIIPVSGSTGGLSLAYLDSAVSTYVTTGDFTRYVYSIYIGSNYKGYIAVKSANSSYETGLVTDFTYNIESGLISGLDLYDYFEPGVYVYTVW